MPPLTKHSVRPHPARKAFTSPPMHPSVRRRSAIDMDSPLQASGSWRDEAHPQSTVPTQGDVRPALDAGTIHNDRAA